MKERKAPEKKIEFNREQPKKSSDTSKNPEEILKKIIKILSFGKQTPLNIVYHIYLYFSELKIDQKPKILQEVGNVFGEIETNDELQLDEKITRDEELKFSQFFRPTISSIFFSIVNQNLEPEEFYKQVWNSLVENPFFPDEKTKAFALFFVLQNEMIPYFKIDSGYKMSDDDFKQISKKLKDTIKKIRFLLARDFSQKTEQSSLVYSLIEKFSEPSDKIVLFVHFTEILKRKIMFESLKENLSDNSRQLKSLLRSALQRS